MDTFVFVARTTTYVVYCSTGATTFLGHTWSIKQWFVDVPRLVEMYAVPGRHYKLMWQDCNDPTVLKYYRGFKPRNTNMRTAIETLECKGPYAK